MTKKVAIITGASRGIGYSVAQGLASDGFEVVMIAQTKSSLEQVAAKLALTHYAIDVAQTKVVEEVVKEIILKFGQIDLLFNNAGINISGTCEVSEQEFDRLIDVNLKGAWNFARAVVPQMKLKKGGYIINTSSICGKIGFSGTGVYSSSKFGLLGLNDALFNELTPLGIRVSALCPSWVATDMASHSSLSIEEMIQPEDILTTVRYLLSLGTQACVKEIVIQCKATLS